MLSEAQQIPTKPERLPKPGETPQKQELLKDGTRWVEIPQKQELLEKPVIRWHTPDCAKQARRPYLDGATILSASYIVCVAIVSYSYSLIRNIRLFQGLLILTP